MPTACICTMVHVRVFGRMLFYLLKGLDTGTLKVADIKKFIQFCNHSIFLKQTRMNIQK